jgi:hypothetical protein
MVSIIPMIAGVALAIMDFEWLLVSLVVVLFLLAFPGNGYIRGSLACRHCKQRSIGCPAEQLFSNPKDSLGKDREGGSA